MALGGNPVFANNKNFKDSPAVQRGYLSGGADTMGAQGAMSAAQLQDLYSKPSASPQQTGRMSYDDVIMKTVFTLAMVLAGAALGWFVPILMLPGAIVGFVLAMVNSFKKVPSPGLILAYAAFEGMFLGGLSGFLEGMYPGIVIQAVLGTLSVFIVTLILFRNAKVRATPKMTRFFLIALAGYALFSLVNFFLMIFNVTNEPWGIRSMDIPGTNIPFGLVIGLLAVGLAAFSLIVDFTSIEQGVKNGLPAKFAWSAAFGLTVTLVWLYVEILRLLAILRGND